MRFTIFQFIASDAAIDHLNTVGWGGDFGSYPELAIQRDVKFMGGSKAFQPWMFAHYYVVANIKYAQGLEDVFHIGNGYGDQSQLERIAERMHSVSVGDIVLCHDTNTYYMCDSVGWTQINIREAA